MTFILIHIYFSMMVIMILFLYIIMIDISVYTALYYLGISTDNLLYANYNIELA